MNAKQRVAAAIANERGNRRGAPTIINILDVLPPKLLQEVNEEADAVLETLAYQDLLEACKRLLDAPHYEHFAVRLNDEEMAALDAITAAIAKAEGRSPAVSVRQFRNIDGGAA